MTTQNKFKKTLATLALSGAIACSGCTSQNVSISKLEDARIEAGNQPGVEVIEGMPISSNYTSNQSENYLSLLVKTGENRYQVCSIDTKKVSLNQDGIRKYNNSNTIIHGAISEKSKVKVIGNISPEGLRIKSIETLGYKLNFEGGQ